MQEAERKAGKATGTSYGSWSSPITADLIVKGSVSLSEVLIDGTDVYWLEGRPNENGRNVVVRYDEGAAKPIDVTPPFVVGSESYFDVRTGVYEYGGAAWLVEGRVLYFSNYSDGRLYRQGVSGVVPTPLTPEPPPGPDGKPKPLRYYADGIIDQAHQRWIGVVEDWSRVEDPLKQQPENCIVSIDLSSHGLDAGRPLARGHDFFSSPRLSPDGAKLTWLAWDHPRMPWQGTSLYLVDFDSAGSFAGEPVLIAGGPEESILQPEWSPDGTELWFISDRSGWWNLYRYDLSSKRVGQIAPMDKEFGEPQWTLGPSTYAFTTDGRVVVTYSEEGLAKLALVDRTTREFSDIRLPPLLHRLDTSANIDIPYTTIKSVRVDATGRVAFAAGSPRAPMSIVGHDLASGKPQILKKATELADDLAISRHLTDVTPIKFPTTNGEVAYALYYPPFNADYVGPPDEKPPLIVMSHGGPTAQASSTLSFQIQYWTSRGIAVLDVNYRGSSGFGKNYRDRLRGKWGIVDVEDCVNGARYLSHKGLVDLERTVIMGGSAGGYTTLAALTSSSFHDFFRAGASYYGIGDLESLAKTTHKFESHYLDWLVGPREQLRERSPISHIDRLSRPAIFFQGECDPIVPPDQAEAMFDAIKKRGELTGYFLFAEESHGFRRAENIRRSIEAAHFFFAFQVFRSRLSFGNFGSCQKAALADTSRYGEVIKGTRRQNMGKSYGSSRMRMAEMAEMDECARPGEKVFNVPHYHAFVLLGKERLFACHLTQFFCEVHRYQIVFEVGLPESLRLAFIREREAHPADSYFLANTKPDPDPNDPTDHSKVGNTCDDPMTIPEVAGRLRTSFVGNVFRGIPQQQKYEHWPWQGHPPVHRNFPVSVERIVHFRPLSDSMDYPSNLTYLLFGAANEAHMMHYATKEPDYDHIVSLRAAPSWLANDMLAAGVMVDLPDVPRLGVSDASARVRCAKPFDNGATVQVRYRGDPAGPHRPVSIGHSYWFCTRVCNERDPCPGYEPCGSPTPEEYLSK